MLRAAQWIILLLTFLAGNNSYAVAEMRVALVIGNAAYEHTTPLKNPKNDANAVTEILGRLGFEVVEGIDLTDRQFGRVVAQFRKKLSGADVALFFYAGHGLQVHGQNYLAPVDARLEDEDSLEFEAVRLRAILALMEREPRTNLVFLDACRDNPLARNLARNLGTRSAVVGRGFAREETGIGTMVAFATQPGNVALDGTDKHSPFTSALLKYIETPGQDIADLMRRVRLDVISATSSRQVPWNNSSLTAPFIFKAKPKPKPRPVAAPSKPDVGAREIDLAFWNSAKENGTQAAYEAYLERYPEGVFSVLARLSLAALKGQSVQAEERDRPAEVRGRLEAEHQPLAENTAAGGPVQVASVSSDAPATPEPEPGKTLDRRELALALQTELKRVGCDPGKLDGIWGRKGRDALARFNKHANLSMPDDEPTQQTVNAVKARRSRVCLAVTVPKIKSVAKKPAPSPQRTAPKKPQVKFKTACETPGIWSTDCPVVVGR